MRKATTADIVRVVQDQPVWSANTVVTYLRAKDLRATAKQVAGVMSAEAKRRKASAAEPAKTSTVVETVPVANPVTAAGPDGVWQVSYERLPSDHATAEAFDRLRGKAPDGIAAVLPVVRRLGGIPATRKALDELAALLGG